MNIIERHRGVSLMVALLLFVVVVAAHTNAQDSCSVKLQQCGATLKQLHDLTNIYIDKSEALTKAYEASLGKCVGNLEDISAKLDVLATQFECRAKPQKEGVK